MEAQLEYIHNACTFFFGSFGADLHAQSVLINEISAPQLRRKFTKSALLVGEASITAGGISCKGFLRQKRKEDREKGRIVNCFCLFISSCSRHIAKTPGF